jgi:NTP pyrophosphatase (non-canonical NTP hydrolase)
MSDYTLSQIQQQVDNWISSVGKGYWSPHEMLARLVEEVGETARLINHLYGSKPKKSSELTQELGSEFSDILFTIICIANAQNINLQQAFEQMMVKYSIRDRDRF